MKRSELSDSALSRPLSMWRFAFISMFASRKCKWWSITIGKIYLFPWVVKKSLEHDNSEKAQPQLLVCVCVCYCGAIQFDIACGVGRQTQFRCCLLWFHHRISLFTPNNDDMNLIDYFAFVARENGMSSCSTCTESFTCALLPVGKVFRSLK